MKYLVELFASALTIGFLLLFVDFEIMVLFV